MPRKNSTKNQKTEIQASQKSGCKNYKNDGIMQVIAWFGPVVFGLISLFAGLLYSNHIKIALWCIVAAVITLLIYLLVLLEWYICREQQPRKSLRIVISALIVVSLFVGYEWQAHLSTPRKWLELSEEQKKHFVSILKSQQSEREQIKLGCAAMSEETCASSSKFLDLFKRGGWVVQVMYPDDNRHSHLVNYQEGG
jgi:hypothetical protein